MKISEVIKQMQKFQKKFGDVEVGTYDPDELAKGFLKPTEAFVGGHTDEGDKVTHMILMDRETANSGDALY